MGKAQSNIPAQGSGDVPTQEAEVEQIDHVISQEDLDENPELLEEGVEVGETVQFSAESDVEYVVLKEFRDQKNFDKIYSEGEIISLEQYRIDHLLSIGYIKAND